MKRQTRKSGEWREDASRKKGKGMEKSHGRPGSHDGSLRGWKLREPRQARQS